MKTRYRLYLSGEVQGVGFRGFVERVASRFGLKGWTKNLEDGGVEVVLEGEEGDLKETVKILGRGSPFSRIEKLEVKEEDYTGEFDSFEIG